MKKFFIAIMAIVSIAAMASCTDPIYNNDPADTRYAKGFPLEQFHKFGQDGDTAAQRQLVNQYRKVLTSNVVSHYPNIQDENNIHFVLGSGFAKDVLTESGKTHSGKFKNELIIIIDDPTIKDTLFLACGNGMLSPIRWKEKSDFGNAEQWPLQSSREKAWLTTCPSFKPGLKSPTTSQSQSRTKTAKSSPKKDIGTISEDMKVYFSPTML